MDRIIRFILAPLVILGGLWFIALPFAFATLSFGDRLSPPTWGEYLGEVFRGGSSAIGIGLVAVIAGLYLASSRKGPPDRAAGTKRP